mmetsp:Transcript_37350/g.105381  ORF Transcript_37350/g.105381 Transcript_37350/m.105381 type:complete len:87 (+) Transcript_37350:873-1133(+)
MPGDWRCQECDFHNFARNTTCYRCDAEKPHDENEYGPRAFTDARAGYWTCPECSAHNMAGVEACLRCDTNKPHNSEWASRSSENRS